MGESNTNYYLASGFDRIFLQPCGNVNIMGYKVTSPFLRGLLDKLGVVPQFVARKEYKNAPNTVRAHARVITPCPSPAASTRLTFSSHSLCRPPVLRGW